MDIRKSDENNPKGEKSIKVGILCTSACPVTSVGGQAITYNDYLPTNHFINHSIP